MGKSIVNKRKIEKKFKGKKVLVFGIGILGGGVGVCEFFVNLGAKVTATDLKTREKLGDKVVNRLENLGVELVLGGHREKDILGSDLIIRNPGVPKNSKYLRLALKNKIPVTMDAALFAKLCPLPIIGITGTRGKTTTVNILASILKEAGRNTLIGGNIPGKATLSLLWELEKQSKIVLELSSWALQGFISEKISPQIALITNIYPDHLNRYESMQEYIEDKASIFKFQKSGGLLFLNKYNKNSMFYASKAKTKVNYFSDEDLPLDWKLKVEGEHNRANAAAALTVARQLGVLDKFAKSALLSFKGVPYRLELIRNKNGILFVNDTTSTTPVATIAALKTFIDRSIVLIIGGASKNLPLGGLVDMLKKSSIREYIFVAGDGTEKLTKLMKKQEIITDNYKVYSDLEKAINAAYKKAKKKDIVLFSPAFTSFAMFNNEFHRGDEFNRIVNSL
jgi:UDP-N-acetylmuramoylalanine--D-glutamate ligase